MTDTWTPIVASWEPLASSSDDEAMWSRLARFERLGASVEELAKETLESIMGFEGKGGHKPPRADIQKMKDVNDLWYQFEGHRRTVEDEQGNPGNSLFQLIPPERQEQNNAGHREWNERFGLTDQETGLIAAYNILVREYGPEAAFDSLARMLETQTDQGLAENVRNLAPTMGGEISPDARKAAGALLKKNEERHYGQLYAGISEGLDDLYRRNTASYKLWPWAVKQMKAEFNRQLASGHISEPGRGAIRFGHIVDIVSEGGVILDQLRRENRLPQNFDVNKLDFKDFEEWLMQWKRENREANSQGEVVYQFHDGWTIQKLTTEDQLQFEGDEMGHCVGGYSHQVSNGQTIIYSLRDPKGNPHVTMEIEALEGPLNLTPEDEEVPEDAIYNHEYVHPDQHSPGEHLEGKMEGGYQPNGQTPFEVVQVQGNANSTPKPEYQRKIKEFLDALREKGWKFVRSDGWYAPHDEDGHDEYGDSVRNASQLDDWWDHYRENVTAYQSGGEDAYGLNRDRMTVPISDYSELMTECVASLVDDQDRDRWHTRDYQSLAQAVYHAWSLDTTQDTRSQNKLEIEKKNFENVIDNAQEKVDEWTHETLYYQDEYMQQEIGEKFEELLQEKGFYDGLYEEVEQRYEQDENHVGDVGEELIELGKERHEDLWEQAEEKVRDEFEDAYAGNAHRFIGYLYNLVEHNGVVNPAELPDPNQTHGGLPSHDELRQKNEERSRQQQMIPTLDLSEGIPGALSSWRSLEDRTGVSAPPPTPVMAPLVQPAPATQSPFPGLSVSFPGAEAVQSPQAPESTAQQGGQLLPSSMQHADDQHTTVYSHTSRGVKSATISMQSCQVNEQDVMSLPANAGSMVAAWVGIDDGNNWIQAGVTKDAGAPPYIYFEHGGTSAPYKLLKIAPYTFGQSVKVAVVGNGNHSFSMMVNGKKYGQITFNSYSLRYLATGENRFLAGHPNEFAFTITPDMTPTRHGGTTEEAEASSWPAPSLTCPRCGEGPYNSVALLAQHSDKHHPEWRKLAVSHPIEIHPIEIHPIDHEHNVWFDTDGNQRQRYRPGWAKNPTTGKMEQTGELEDTFLDKHGRQGQGWVAYNDDVPVGSLTYVDDSGWQMIGTAFVHPEFREQGIFNQLAAPLRQSGRPTDAYVWENPWLKQKVRSWS